MIFALLFVQGCDRLLECGTTCTLALVQGDQLCVANVGDSSAALVRYNRTALRAP